MVRGLTTEERFTAKVEIDPATGCWVWTASRLPDGYGSFWDGTWRRHRVPRIVRAHRWSYDHYVGPIPKGLEVCHRCDRPPCCNPDHLFLGTHGVNMADSAAKGRQGRNAGEGNGRAKVTAEQVAEMRRRSTGRYGEISEMAREYGLGSGTVSKILKGQTWQTKGKE